MTTPDAHREFKDRLYGQFARIGKALSARKDEADTDPSGGNRSLHST